MTGFAILLGYILLFILCFLAAKLIYKAIVSKQDFTSLKTVTFGDETAVRANRVGSLFSILVIFFIWGLFTNSVIVPFHVPGPFIGEATFTYTAQNAAGAQDDANVTVIVYEKGNKPEKPVIEQGQGFAKNDSKLVQVWRSALVKVQDNDEGGKEKGYQVIAINGTSIAPGQTLEIEAGNLTMTARGTLNFKPKAGLQMQPLYLPSPEKVLDTFTKIANKGYQNIALWEHLGYSLFRVITGFFLGALVGIPLGYAMGLSGWFRGWFDPIVEFMRPVPPLALIPLVIIWFGIGETGKIVLLFLAALWIMAIAARAGVAGISIAKIHAAYSLGASKTQILSHVIMPNSLPEIFTGARVAMGVCWGTVVAAELVAAEKGIGKMIMVAAKFAQTDIVIMGIIIIGIVGFAIDVLMRFSENLLVPWRGRA